MTRQEMISRLDARYDSNPYLAADELFAGVFGDIGFEALNDRGLELLLGWCEAPTSMVAIHRGKRYRADGSFDEAWQAIAAQLPEGQPDEIVDLDAFSRDRAIEGCNGGSLHWHDGNDSIGAGWRFRSPEAQKHA